jgi:DNA polymerase-3 subunit gamma/tau
MRDAQSTLDQLISFCGARIVESDVLSMFGLASRQHLLALAGAILAADRAGSLRLLHDLASGGKDLGRLLGDLLAHFRNLLLLELSGGDRNLVEVTDAEWTALQTQSKQVDATALTRILEVLSRAEGRLREAPSKRIFLEVTLINAVEARTAVGLDEILRQLKALREGAPVPAAPPAPVATPPAPPAPVAPAPPASSLSVAPTPVSPASGGVVQVSTPPPAPPAPVAPVRTPATPSPAPSVSLQPASTPQPTPMPVTSAVELWSTLYAGLEKGERMLWTLLAGSEGRSWELQTLTVACSPDALELVTSGKTATLLRTRLRELAPGDSTLKFVPGATAPTVDLAAPAPSRPKPTVAKAPEDKPQRVEPVKLNREEFLSDPVIQDAMRIFRAQLIEVRGGG